MDFRTTNAGDTTGDISILGNSVTGVTTTGLVLRNTAAGGNRIQVSGNVFQGTGINLTIDGLALISVTGNTFYNNATTSATPNADIDDCTRIIFTANVFRTAGTTSAENINLNSNCDIFLVNDNVCDMGGAPAAGTQNINQPSKPDAIMGMNLLEAGGVGTTENSNAVKTNTNLVALSTGPISGEQY
jgi:hypothetical protein